MRALLKCYRFLIAPLTAALLILQSGGMVTAALATTITYNFSRHKISTAANHELRFKTPTGVDAASDTIVITYPSGFSLTAINSGDVDLSHGAVTGLETSETLASSAAAGVWGVATSTSSITFTAPTDAGVGEIAANQFVVVRVGTNAVGGLNQIVNPPTVQTARIAVGGTFGDTSVISIPIIAEDSVIVSATVPSPAPPPPPPCCGGVGDNVPPMIFNVDVINITSSSAMIVWDTNESANSTVEYGLTANYQFGVNNASYVLHHTIPLSGLISNTTYHFRVSSKDTSGNLGASGDYSFKTLGDTAAPVITNIQVVNITDTSADVTWNTDELADSKVDYGTSQLYGSFVSNPGFVTTHLISLSGLQPNTLYHLFVTSKDQSLNAASSTDVTFTTSPDVTPPANVSNFTAVGGDAVVHLNWNLPSDPDFAGTRIVRRTDGFPTHAFDGTLVYLGIGKSVDDIQVVNGTTYYYGAFAFDTSSNFASGALASAKPMGVVLLGPENTGPLCSNGIDDDGDGMIDCQDSECSALQVCAPPPIPIPENTNAACSNGVDDDSDGLIDCADPDCGPMPVCAAVPPVIPPVPIPTESKPTPDGKIIIIDPHFFDASGKVELLPDVEKNVGALAGSAVLVKVPIVNLGVQVEHGYIMSPLFNLTLNADGTAFEGTYPMPSEAGSYHVTVVLTYKGGGSSAEDFTLIAQNSGKVVEQTLFGLTDIAIEDSIVTLFVDQGGWIVWNGAQYGQINPQITGEDGEFAYFVPNGRYYVDVEKEGYKKASSAPRIITKNVFGETVGLIKIPPSPEELIVPGTTTLQGVGLIAGNIFDQIMFGATVLRAFLQRPDVQDAVENKISPALLAVAIINIATALPLFNAFAYLQYIFAQPILLIGRRRKKKWGVVYNSLTKQPVDLAIVRLLQADTRLVIQTKVTDKFGRYSFVVRAGTYIIDVVKPGYVYPTQYLKDKKEDVEFVDLYHASPVTAVDGFVIAHNVPLDPVVPIETPKKILLRKTLRNIQQYIALFTIIGAMAALIIVPSLQVALLTLAQVGSYLLFKRLATPIKPKEWGIAYDEETRQPLSRVIVRIFDKKFNKLLETQVTDTNGKYGFFVRRNVYYVTAEKEGYVKYTSPDIDLSTKDEALVDQSLSMKKV